MEQALANMPWSEMKSILSDIEVLLEANEEADVLKNIKQLRADLQTLFTGKETDARKLIAGALPCGKRWGGNGPAPGGRAEAVPAASSRVEEGRGRREPSQTTSKLMPPANQPPMPPLRSHNAHSPCRA